MQCPKNKLSDPTVSPSNLILASASPRRAELLHMCGIPFVVEPASIDEEKQAASVCARYAFKRRFGKIVQALARAKAHAIFERHADCVVLGADTIVVLGGKILGKPKSDTEALCMLRKLSGKKHIVFTGVCIVSDHFEDTFYTQTSVVFRKWNEETEALAHQYIASGSSLDKAGAYGIQDMGGLFVKRISGDYFTVVGLPVNLVHQKLREMHFPF